MYLIDTVVLSELREPRRHAGIVLGGGGVGLIGWPQHHFDMLDAKIVVGL
jgi:hypothetical protein